MTKKELINRWQTPTGTILLEAILKAFKKKINLDLVPNLQLIEGKWDLRGAPLSTLIGERTIGADGHFLTQKFGSLTLKRIKFKNVDFSYACINYSTFVECSFDDCVFIETAAKEIHIYASDFNTCKFSKVNFSYSFMNNNVANKAGSFKNCTFSYANLKECTFTFPIMDNCVFQDCNLYATDFDGTRMRNVTFLGKVNSCWFRGYSNCAQKSLFWIFNRVDPKQYPNRMENVDFSDAILIGVSFSHSIDLSRCSFPKSQDYIFVKDLEKTMTGLKSFIIENWKGEYKRKGVALIENVYFSPEKHNQKSGFIDTFPVPSSDLAFDEKFFNLMREFN